MSKSVLTQARLRELLSYDPVTGIFIWNERKREDFSSSRAWKMFQAKHAGKRAGYQTTEGYRKIGIDGKDVPEHRLAWLYVHGYLPDQADHQNGRMAENTIRNLRDVSHAANMKNKAIYRTNKSGYPGVVWEKGKSLWVARIPVDGRLRTLGRSKDKSAAIALRQKAEADLGYHPNHGRAA